MVVAAINVAVAETQRDEGGFGRRLAEARAMAGLSARELSTRAGLARSIVSLFEAGKKGANAETVAKLADVLGVSMDWLYRGVGIQPSMRRIKTAVAAHALKPTGTEG